MAVRTKELGKGFRSANGTSTIYTTPSGKTAIVKELTFYNSGGTPATFRIEVVRSAVATVVHRTGTLAGQTSQALTSRFLVLEPADVLRIVVESLSSGILDWWVSGSELDGVA